MTTLIGIIVVLAVVGVALYLLGVLVPMEPRVRQVIYALVGLVLFLWIVQSLGVFTFPVRLR